MAGVVAVLQTPEVATGVATKTLLQLLAPANQRVLVHEVSISLDGVVNTDAPIAFEVVRQSTAGTGGSALTAKKWNPDDSETLQTTGLQNIVTAEPTTTDEILGEQVHPQGAYTYQMRFGTPIHVPGGGRLGIRVITPGVDVNAKVRILFEE